METTSLTVLFHEKLARYQNLIEALEYERQYLLSGRSEELWQVSSRKQQIVSEIEALRGRILQELTEAGTSHDLTVPTFQSLRVLSLLPLAQRKPLLKIQEAINRKKEEIQERTRENVSHVEAYLTTLDDLIRIFTRHVDDSVLYDRHCTTGSTRARPLLHREA